MSKFSPHIRFPDGKCREGMEFYKSVFGGKIDFMTMGDVPKESMPDPEMDKLPKNLIMHARLEAKDFILLGADMFRDPVKVGDQVSIMVDCKSEKEVDDVFNKLAEGGDVFMKPMKMFWGGYFGSVTDKYGVEWGVHFQMTPMKK